jgi:hypothetical protein
MTAAAASVRTARRVAAALLVAGGALGALVPALHPGHGPGYYANPFTAQSHLLLFAAVLLVSMALPTLAREGGGGCPAATLGAAGYFVGLWCLDGTHGIIDGAVLPALAAVQPKAAPLLAPGVASQSMLAAGPMGLITDVGMVLFIGGSLALGAALARGRVVPRAVAWFLAVAWALVPVSFAVPLLRGPALTLPYLALVLAGVTWAASRARRRRARRRARRRRRRGAPRRRPRGAGDGVGRRRRLEARGGRAWAAARSPAAAA